MKKINDFRKEEFLTLYKKGLNDYDIARTMDISSSTIYRWRRSFGLSPTHNRVLSRCKEIVPTQEQLEILTGTLLGDSSLQLYPKYGWINPIFKCDHGPKQKDYTEHIKEKLDSLNSTIYKYNKTDKRFNKRYITYTVKTKSNPYYIGLFNSLYYNGIKVITKEFLKNFTARSLAYLYMDDGYADQKTAFICTDNFSEEDTKVLIDHININLNLKFTRVNHGKYYRLRLSLYDFEKFKSLVSPYMLESLKYKLDTVS